MTNALVCRELTKTFGAHRAVDGLDLTVASGAIFGLLGSNGSGKTSSLRTCLGIYRPDGGWFEILGSRDPLAVRHQVGYLPEERGLYARMPVQEQLAFLASIHGLSRAESHRRAGSWLERVGLADQAAAATGELSKGMQQKVQFAAAVIHEPALLVLDEPFTGLDPVNARLLTDLILEQRDRGATVVLSTHRMEQVEALCEWICLLHQGRPVLNGRLADVKHEHGRHTVVAEYDGDRRPLGQLAGVRACEDRGRVSRLHLEPEADPHDVIRAVVARVDVRGIRIDEPRIEDIYVEKVGAA